MEEKKDMTLFSLKTYLPNYSTGRQGGSQELNFTILIAESRPIKEKSLKPLRYTEKCTVTSP